VVYSESDPAYRGEDVPEQESVSKALSIRIFLSCNLVMAHGKYSYREKGGAAFSINTAKE
jgi:hypothetical protein